MGGVEFDAVLEDTLQASAQITTYPIEAGANAADHKIIQPFKWSLVGVISNNPLRITATDFTGALSNFIPGGVAATAAGLSAGFAAGSNGTRASDALGLLIDLMASDTPFSIDAVDIKLSNMTIVDIIRTKDPSNEHGLVFEAQLEELPTLDTLLSSSNPKQSQLREGDPAQTQAAEQIDRGEQGLGVSSAANDAAVGQVIA
jgi:hypothetical protein